MRHRQRHLHKTILEFIRTGLDDFGWLGGLPPFGGPAVTLMDYEPQQAGETPALNTVSVSMGDQGADLPFELGGLVSTSYAVFLDVYPVSEPIGVALSDDLKDLLTDNAIPLLDYNDDPSGVPTDLWIEFESVVVELFPVATTTLDKRSWRAVKATAVLFSGAATVAPDPELVLRHANLGDTITATVDDQRLAFDGVTYLPGVDGDYIFVVLDDAATGMHLEVLDTSTSAAYVVCPLYQIVSNDESTLPLEAATPGSYMLGEALGVNPIGPGEDQSMFGLELHYIAFGVLIQVSSSSPDPTYVVVTEA